MKFENIGVAMKYCIAFLFLFIFSGCSVAYYSTETDPQISFTKQEPVTIYTKEIPTITEKKFAILLGELMVENGFNVNGFNIQVEETDCYITFSMDTSSSQQTQSYTTYNTTNTYIPGTYIGNAYIPGRTITTTTPTTNIYTTLSVRKYIGVSIVCKYDKDRKSQVWFGFISVDNKDYEKYQRNIIQNLVNLIGKDFDGSLEIE